MDGAPPAPRGRAARGWRWAAAGAVAAAAGLAGYLLLGRGAAPAPAGPRVELPAPTFGPPPPPPRAGDFVGSEACASCHQDQFRSWSTSTHARAGGPPGRDRVIAAFDGTPIRFRDAVVLPTVTPDGSYVFRVRWQDAPEQTIRVDGVVGGGHMEGGGTQGFVSRHADGTLRFLPFDFARQQGVWFCNTGTRKEKGWVPITPELSLTDCGDWPPVRVMGDGSTFATCQGCHASQIELKFDTVARRYQTRFSSLGINCESCHGPGREHVEIARSGEIARRSDIGMRPLSTLGKEESLRVCFQCHALKSRLSEGYLPGAALEDFYSLKLPMLGEEPYLPDGRVRTFAYQGNHRFSDCYLNGSMTCVDCHDPHEQGYRDQTGTALAGRFSNGQCTGCHVSKAQQVERHTFHPAASAGSRCVGCHMPYLQHPEVGGAIRYGRSDHTIPIPRPAFDQAQGVENACGKCHADRSAAQLQAQVERWWGEVKPHKAVVEGLVRAQRVDDAAEAARLVLRPAEGFPMAQYEGVNHLLLKYLSPDMPALEPEIARGLERLAGDRDVDLRALALASLHFARGEDPRVRALLARHLRSLGSDERRVRTRWATALGALGDRYGAQGRSAEAVTVYRKALEILPDEPRTLVSLGIAQTGAGELDAAVASFRRSLRLDPAQPLALVNLGIALGRMGDAGGAEAAYREAMRVDPTSALAPFNLGNEMLRRRDPAAAAALYARAAELDPGLAPAHFNLARSLILLGRYPQALDAVRSGMRFDPANATAQQMLRDLQQTLAAPEAAGR